MKIQEMLRKLNAHLQSPEPSAAQARKGYEAVFELEPSEDDEDWDFSEDEDPEYAIGYVDGYSAALKDVCHAIANEWGVELEGGGSEER